MTRAEAIATVIEKLTARGLTPSDILSFELEDADEDRLQAMAHGLSIPLAERAAAGVTVLTEAMADDMLKACADAVRMLQPVAAHGASKILAMLAVCTALAAASVLDEDDERTPADFLYVVADSVNQPDQLRQFEEVKRAYHGVQASRDIEDDLRRFEAGDDISPSDFE